MAVSAFITMCLVVLGFVSVLLVGLLSSAISETSVTVDVSSYNNLVKHYNDDFTRYCKDLDGTPVIADRNACVKDEKIIMRESAY